MGESTLTIAVIDFGKTHIRVELFESGVSIERLSMETPLTRINGLLHEDTEAVECWLEPMLANLRPNRIIPVAHGAAYAAIRSGEDAPIPILDYMETPPDTVNETYESLRPQYVETGSPSLPNGLNLGRQLEWMRMADAIQPGDRLVPLAQYWAWRLSRVARTEISSIGCHTDLWRPFKASWSSFAEDRGWSRMFEPFAAAADPLGPCRWPGLENAIVHCGVHDSNAAFVALRQSAGDAQLCLSTGTWHVMAAPGGTLMPPADQDGVVNVTPNGDPLPCLRFMGGEVYRRLSEKNRHGALAIQDIVSRGFSIDGPVISQSGPLSPVRSPEGISETDPVLADLHIACVWNLMWTVLAPKARSIVVEGPALTGHAPALLAAIRPDASVRAAPAVLSAALGGLLLLEPRIAVEPAQPVLPLEVQGLRAYAEDWIQRMEKKIEEARRP